MDIAVNRDVALSPSQLGYFPLLYNPEPYCLGMLSSMDQPSNLVKSCQRAQRPLATSQVYLVNMSSNYTTYTSDGDDYSEASAAAAAA